MIVLDAHVHIQPRFDLNDFLMIALENFQLRHRESGAQDSLTSCLLLAEGKSLDFFSVLGKEGRQPTGRVAGWQVRATAEDHAVQLSHASYPGARMFVMAGRQVITEEKLEVLALATSAEIANGRPLAETVDAVRSGGGLAVLPWGVGKWLGKRGELVGRFLQEASPESLFVGDNGGRPVFWPRPALFDRAQRRGIRLLSGSDPLPLAGEESRVATFGAMIDGELSDALPAAELKSLLCNPRISITPFGNQVGLLQFFRMQLGLRLQKK